MTSDPRQFLIVGASSGIGAALRTRLRSAGARVTTASRSAEPGPGSIRWDATEGELPADSLPDRLDGLVYAPGSINLKPFPRLADADFQSDFEVNVLGAARAVRAALPALKRAENGASVVLFSTVAVAVGMPFHASVAAAKGAVEGLGRSLAAELAPKVRVNVVAPSLTDTPLAARLVSTPERRDASADRHPLKRIGEADEIAALVAALLSPEMSWVTGQVLRPDGGMSSLRTG